MNRRLLYTLLSPILLIAVWYLLASFTPKYLFPYPHTVVYALIELFRRMNLLENMLYTVIRVTIGYVVGVLLGIVLGILVLLSRLLQNLIYPIVAFIIVTPSFAFVPLLMIWVGLNDWLPVTAIIICTAFPIIYAFMSSHKFINRELIAAAMIDGASNTYIVLHIILPLSISHLATILRYEAGHSWRLGFVTEYIALSNGLGALMMYAYSTLRVDEVIALLIIIGILTYAFQQAITLLENTLLKRWGIIQ
ncbi:MAG: hypothetical protein DRO14_02550 [Thermoprotei archaeon]|nr:MAG: hypothetical protein DRO14_02550 [Thermoprotei archaeon]